MPLRTTKLTSFLLLIAATTFSQQLGSVESKTAVLFGATGAVGNDILRFLITMDDHYFTKIVLVGRREFPSKVNDLLPRRESSELPEIVKIVTPDLGSVDRHEELVSIHADACFNAVGAAYPQLSDLHDWNYVETTVAASITRLCSKMNATSISIFSAVDGDSPEPFTDDELAKTGTALGWWPVFSLTIRMMRLKENVVISSSSSSNNKSIPFVRIFQPSNIITEELRYGWLDWTLFKFHAVFDSWLPTHYHSVTTQLLADAMVQDAANVLSGENTATVLSEEGEDGVVRLDYDDFVIIVGKEETEKQTDL